jgi:hypothetical protein
MGTDALFLSRPYDGSIVFLASPGTSEAVSKHCESWKKDRGHAWPERRRLAGMTVTGTAVC